MPSKTQPHQDQIWKGVFFVCTAFFLFTVMQAMNKLLVGQHHIVEIVFYRNFIVLLPCAIYVIISRKIDFLKTTMPRTMIFRVVAGTIGLMLTFAAVQELPISDATVIFFASTLITPVLAYLFLKETIGPHRIIAVIIGMCGVMLVAQPSANVTILGLILALGAAFCHAAVQTTLRALKTQNHFATMFYFFLGSTIVLIFFMPFYAKIPTWENTLLLLGIGLTGGGGQYFLTRGFQMAPTSLLSPFNYTGLIWAAGLDILIWNYVPGWQIYTGSAIIIIAKLYMIYREKRASI